MKKATNCESCSHYVYDEDYDFYECEVGLDQDDMARFLESRTYNCPYYAFEVEYQLARKQ